MNNLKKLFQLSSLLILVAVLWSRPVLARSDFEIMVDFDEDGICDSEFFLGPYYFCTPNEDNKPDNCVDVANPDQTDTDGDGIGDACDEDQEVITDTNNPNDNTNNNNDNTCDPAVDSNCGTPANDNSNPNADIQPIDFGGGCALISGTSSKAVIPQFLGALMLGLMGLAIRLRRRSE